MHLEPNENFVYTFLLSPYHFYSISNFPSEFYLFVSIYSLPTVILLFLFCGMTGILDNHGTPYSNFALSVKLSSIYMTRIVHSDLKSINISTINKTLCILQLHFLFSQISSTVFLGTNKVQSIFFLFCYSTINFLQMQDSHSRIYY